MEIKKIKIEYSIHHGFSTPSMDGVCHVKTLPYLSVVQSVEGSYDISLKDGDTHNTGSGGFFIAPADIRQTITHHSDPNTGNMMCRWVFLKVLVNDLYPLERLYDFPAIVPETYRAQLNRIFDRLFSAQDLFDAYICYHEIIKVLSLIAVPKAISSNPCVDSVIQYISQHFREKIDVALLARLVNMSEPNIYVIFRKATGTSPIAYLNNIRLSHAAEMLTGTDDSISHICDAVGIHDPVYFNKVFRKAFYMSPTKYREIYKCGQ